MATTTANLGLTKPDYTEKADIAVINGNMDKIDTAVQQRDRVWNLLDNSDFRNPVNQRGNTTYAGNMYTIDRWRLWSADGAITLTSEGIKGNGAASSTLYQFVETQKVRLNTVYTVAAGYSDGTIECGSGMFTSSNDIGVWNATAQAYLAYNSGKPFVRLWHATKTVRWVALYEGEYTAETLPAYVPKGYAAELMECQRYYQTVSTHTSAIIVSKTNRAYICNFRTRMRATPTVTVTSLAEYDNWTQTGATSNVNTVHPEYTRIYALGDVSHTNFGYWANITVAASADL